MQGSQTEKVSQTSHLFALLFTSFLPQIFPLFSCRGYFFVYSSLLQNSQKLMLLGFLEGFFFFFGFCSNLSKGKGWPKTFASSFIFPLLVSQFRLNCAHLKQFANSKRPHMHFFFLTAECILRLGRDLCRHFIKLTTWRMINIAACSLNCYYAAFN